MRLTHFILLLKRQSFENLRTWLVGALAIAAILALLLLLTWHWRTSFNGDTSHGIFLLLLFGGGGVFMAGILKDLGNKQKGIWLLTLPAPASAKLAVALFYGIAVYLAIYFGLFYGVKGLIVLSLGKEATFWGHFDLLKNNFYYCLFTFANFQSIILLGSVYFNKSQFLKTVLIIITGFFIAFNGNQILLQIITHQNSINSNIPLDSFQFVYHEENVYVYPGYYLQLASTLLLWVIMPVTLWVATWYRIKEKEL